MHKPYFSSSLLNITIPVFLSFSGISYAATPLLSNITSVATPTSDSTPNYTFNTTEAGSIIYGGDCFSSKKSAAVGNNTLTFTRLKSGNHSNCTLKVKNASGLTSAALVVPQFKITYSSAVKLTVTTSVDFDLDNVPDELDVDTYDMNGNVIKKLEDAGVTGSSIIALLNVYDVNGNVISSSADEDGDGKYDSILKTANTYDTKGNLTKKKMSVKVKGVETPIGMVSYTYDGKNNISSEVYSNDRSGSKTTQYTYNSDGKLLSKKTDYDADKIIDESITFSYNLSGKITKQLVAFETYSFVKAYAYNNSNKLLKYSTFNNYAGSVKSSFTLGYDSLGVVSTLGLDMSGDGAKDVAGTFVLQGDKSLSDEVFYHLADEIF